MSEYYDKSREEFWREQLIIRKHPRYRDMKPIEAMNQLKQDRGEL